MGKQSIFLFLCVLGLLLVLAPSAAADRGISLTSINPASAHAGTTVECDIQGQFLADHHAGDPEFSLVRGAITIAGRTTSWDTSRGKWAKWAKATFVLPSSTAPGAYDLNASQDVGHRSGSRYTCSLPDAFQVLNTTLTTLVITSTKPTSVAAGSGELTLTVYGSGFVATRHQRAQRTHFRGSEVFWNGAEMSTAYISSTELRAMIPAARLATPGTAQVTVHNISDGTVSNVVTFTITTGAQAPTLTGLSPSSTVIGGPAFSLGVTGTNFVSGASGAVVRWNGSDLVTSRDSSTHLTAAVPAALIAAAGSATITVRNGTSPSAPLSNALTFSVANKVPLLTSISPTQVWAGYVRNDVVLTVTGGSFVNGSHVMLGSAEKTGTTFVSAAQLALPLLAADMAVPGTVYVGVKNPAPGGGLSVTTKPLAVVAETSDPLLTISGADSAWHNTPVALSFSATDGQSGVQKLQYQSPPTVAAWTDGASYTVPLTTQGAITVSVQALDWCNRVGTASATVNIDTTQPTTDALNAVSVKKGKSAKLKYRIAEPTNLSPTAQVVLKVVAARSGRTVKTLAINAAPMNATQSTSFKVTFKKGAYKWYVYATDLAGNTQENVAKASLKVK